MSNAILVLRFVMGSYKVSCILGGGRGNTLAPLKVKNIDPCTTQFFNFHMAIVLDKNSIKHIV